MFRANVITHGCVVAKKSSTNIVDDCGSNKYDICGLDVDAVELITATKHINTVVVIKSIVCCFSKCMIHQTTFCENPGVL